MNIRQQKRVSGKKLINTLLPDELKNKYSTTDVLTVAYLEAHEMNDVPVCELCKIDRVPFISIIKGFKRYCPSCGKNKVRTRFVTEGAKHSREYARKKKEYNRINIQQAIDYYASNHCTIKSAAVACNVKSGTLRSELVSLGLVKPNNAKQFTASNFRDRTDHRLFDREYLEECNENGQTLAEIAEELNVAKNTVRLYALKHDIIFKNYGKTERDILEFVRQFDPSAHKTRSVIPPYEIDIYSPEFKFGIELNGEYWHSSDKKDRNYHLDKQILAENQNIRLIQIYFHEWIEKRDIIESMILSNMNQTSRIYGRTCTAVKLDKQTSTEFFKNNHLHGNIPSRIAYGLYHDDILVAAASFGKPRYDKTTDVELLRYSNRLNTTVVGGFGKLIKVFARENEFNKMITYSHRRLFEGSCYLRTGFELVRQTTPGYFWYKNGQIVSRYKTQKHRLKTELTENEYMKREGYIKVYDCGQRVFIMNK